jgi:HD superfamily phosphohydrolase YqeK
MRVAELARDIAIANGLDADCAYFAGVVHDIARDLPYTELHRLAPPENEIDAGHALAVHGRAGRSDHSRGSRGPHHRPARREPRCHCPLCRGRQ